MAYDYFTDIYDALWDGAENGEEPYVTIIADNPLLFDEVSEQRILSTIEAVRSHMELLADRDEARLFHFCLSTMLEGIGSGGFVYGATSDNENAVVEGNVVNPVFVVGDRIDLGSIDGVTITDSAFGSPATATGTDLDTVIADINGTLDAEFTASRTQDGRLRITQAPTGGATRAAGFAVTRLGTTNDNITTNAGIIASSEARPAGDFGTIYLPKVIEVANNCRDRALAVFVGQIREPGLNT
jgi:hypothetical protein